MKKHIIYSLLIIAMIVTTTSCEEDFLETSSTEDVGAINATATTDNLNLIVNGIYRLLYTRLLDKNGNGSNRKGGIGSLMAQNSFMGEDVVQNAVANSYMLGHARWIAHRSATSNRQLHNWRLMYKVIVNANIVINGAAEATGPEEDKNAALGQALFLRAWAHFHLVQLYSKRYVAGANNSQQGIPILTETLVEPQAPGTVEEVYTQINDDITNAISLMEGYARFNPSHANQNVARGLKARVALVQENYVEAASMAVLARAGFSLADSVDYASGFNDYEISEWIWGLHYNTEQGSAFTNFHSFMSRNFSSNQIRGNPKSISPALYNSIPTTDVRSVLYSVSGDHDNLPPGISLISRHKRFPYTSQKFLAYETGDSRGDVPLMRSAEMYLIEAEALAKQAAPDFTAAAAALFALGSARDPAYVLSTNTGQTLLDEIALQRRWELWGEGFRFTDLKRKNEPMVRLSDDDFANEHDVNLIFELNIPAGDDRWQWLIPQDELNANPLINQNK